MLHAPGQVRPDAPGSAVVAVVIALKLAAHSLEWEFFPQPLFSGIVPPTCS